jgi:5-oxoprolinase (ATP-hydrolysing) subunit C
MIEVTAAAGVVTVQDMGRPGWMHQGVAPGGALVPALLARANVAAGNAPDAAALEIVGKIVVRAQGDRGVATDDGTWRALADGETFEVSCGRARVRYLAVHGGLDVPVVLGSRSTLLVARLGGHLGRALRKGDALAVGHDAPRSTAPSIPDAPDLDARVRVVPGPDVERFASGALDVLLGSIFTVSPRSDRVGVRLAGPVLVRAGDDAGVSSPMVRGALQVPAGGEPIVLGPDHPTTGGYPVVATVVSADVGAVMARPVGCAIRFALATRK